MSSQSAFILCPLVLASVYSWNHEAAFYCSSLVPFVSSICVVMLMQYPGSKYFGKAGKHELPLSDAKPSNDVDTKEGEKNNTVYPV